jgi:iron complex outermembrane recepter protein
MSELMNASVRRENFRWQLLATVSAIALIGFGYGTNAARADDDSDRPSLWIELGGQLSRLDDGQEAFAPAFPNSPPRPSMFSPSQKFERMPSSSVDETGKISFEPDGSNWVFSASVRYGRSISKKDVNQQTYPLNTYFHYLTYRGVSGTRTGRPIAARFANTSVQNDEHHLVLDFQAGRDVGLGMFGKDGSSVFGLGVRFAQFNTKSNIALKSDPDWHRLYKYVSLPVIHATHEKLQKYQPYHSNAASISAARSFHGIGPSLSWNASAPFIGNTKGGELTVDWGVNAAILFGRQRAKVHHQTTGRYHSAGSKYHHPTRPITYQGPAHPDHTRVRTVMVPNVGGFAGLTFQIQNFKISAGYRADLFFGPMDGGIDTAKKENVGFYGPFASVSIGLGG